MTSFLVINKADVIIVTMTLIVVACVVKAIAIDFPRRFEYRV